jgi:hypothetical protein
MRIHSDRECRSSSAGHTKLHHITTKYRNKYVLLPSVIWNDPRQ